MKVDFILHVKYKNDEGEDKLFRQLVSRKEFGASSTVLFEKIVKKTKEAFYRLTISPASLIRLKKMLDLNFPYRSLELFVFKEW